MKDGYIKAAAITPELRVADVDYNTEIICAYMKEAAERKIKVVVFPELCITGYTCLDLFLQDSLLEAAKAALLQITEFSKYLDGLFFVGLPLAVNAKLYNVAAAVSRGRILGIVPKIHLPNYNEFYEARNFYSGKNLSSGCRIANDYMDESPTSRSPIDRYHTNSSSLGKYHTCEVLIGNQLVPISSKLIFTCETMPALRIGVELCEDLWVPAPPSIGHCMAGATMIVNLSASNEITGKSSYRRELVAGQSGRLICGYIYASAGGCESTQDVVYSGHNILGENGSVLAESKVFSTGITASEFDMKKLEADRRKMTTYDTRGAEEYLQIPFTLESEDTELTRYMDPMPFVPSDKTKRDQRCDEILNIQAMGLKKRLEHTRCQHAVIGISGGLDSTLALLVTVRAFDLLGLDHKGILAVTMPGFGTTDRTYTNAVNLIRCIDASYKEINIAKAVNLHFADIGHDASLHDVTYENSQARERTQLLMDLANKHNGMVIGTGDLSELALGWATYNGDHMSMYAVNASVPKTLVRYLVGYYADTSDDALLKQTLYDVLDTPVSPELLPPENGKIAQKTEDLVGPYELHDFFLYNMLRYGSSPSKINRMARLAFKEQYEAETILKWEKTFYRRFFAQHFKRSCLPDGPKVGSVSVSPRGDLRMPTDGCVNVWMKELEEI